MGQKHTYVAVSLQKANRNPRGFSGTKMRQVWSFLQKLKMALPFDPKNPKSPIWKNIHTPVLVAVLFVIAKTWK